MLPKLCHLDNDLVIIIIIQYEYIHCVVHIMRLTYLVDTLLPGDIFFSRYPSVALARNSALERG